MPFRMFSESRYDSEDQVRDPLAGEILTWALDFVGLGLGLGEEPDPGMPAEHALAARAKPSAAAAVSRRRPWPRRPSQGRRCSPSGRWVVLISESRSPCGRRVPAFGGEL